MFLGQILFSWLRFLGLSIMDRYIIAEIFAPFLFGLGMFSSLGISIGVLFDLVRKITEYGLPLQIGAEILLLSMPQFIAYGFPMSMLLATLMAYSRLSSDSELIALRSLGVSVYRLIIPAVVISLAITVFTFIFSEFVVPQTNYQAAITLEKALNDGQPSLQRDNIIYPEYSKIKDADGHERKILTRLFYAEQYNGQEMKGVTVLDRSQQGVSQILTSQSASWNFVDNIWDFFNGSIYRLSPDASYSNIVRFENHQLQLPRAPLDLATRVRDNTEMSIAQAQEHLEILKFSDDEKKIRKLQVRIQQKISLPFACLVFGLVGAALGVRPQNTSRATSFGISVLIILFYYFFFAVPGEMGVSGTLPPLIAAWFANLLGLGVGLVVLVKAAR